MTKVCNECQVEKLLTEFSFHRTGRKAGKPAWRCKKCANVANKNRVGKYKDVKRQYYIENLEKIKKYSQEYREKNRARNSERARLYQTGLRKTDPLFRLVCYVRSSIWGALGDRKNKASTRYLGCPIAEFRAHIEKQFWTGMSWQNQGQWHLDHIKPCASFDLSDPAQQAACFHFSNWQPLWADDNLIKSDRLDWTPVESKHTQ